jgi:hypothetical protein
VGRKYYRKQGHILSAFFWHILSAFFWHILSAFVFTFSQEVYISVVKRLFPRVIYPTQDEIKESLKDYLNEKFPEFMANLSANDFANRFHGVWCSQVSNNI